MNSFLKKSKKNDSTINKIIKTAGYILTIISVLYIIWISYTRWQEIIKNFSITQKWPILLISTIIYSASYFIIIFSWKKLVKGFGGYLTFRNSYIICGQSQIAKYIPGNIFHYVGRLILGKRAGLPNSIIINSTLLEAMLLVVSSVIIALLSSLILGWQNFLSFDINRLLIISIIVFTLILITYICIRIIPRFRNWLIKNNLIVDSKTINLKILSSILFLVFILYIVFFTIFGLNLWYTSNYLWPTEFNIVLIFIGSYAISWVAGLITPGAPGGIGIREVVLVTLLSPYLYETRALTLALVFRIITILGDGLLFVTTYLFRIRFKKT